MKVTNSVFIDDKGDSYYFHPKSKLKGVLRKGNGNKWYLEREEKDNLIIGTFEYLELTGYENKIVFLYIDQEDLVYGQEVNMVITLYLEVPSIGYGLSGKLGV